MIKSTKRAFTLVELIVVITILAILGTIAFISLQGYSADARNSKRQNDVNSIAQKISIELAKGVKADQFADTTATGLCLSGSTSTASTWKQDAGTGVNFGLLNEDSNSFRDPFGCKYNYINKAQEVSGTDITGQPVTIQEQLFEVYTWREGSTPITTISAGRTLTGSIIP